MRLRIRALMALGGLEASLAPHAHHCRGPHLPEHASGRERLFLACVGREELLLSDEVSGRVRARVISVESRLVERLGLLVLMIAAADSLCGDRVHPMMMTSPRHNAKSRLQSPRWRASRASLCGICLAPACCGDLCLTLCPTDSMPTPLALPTAWVSLDGSLGECTCLRRARHVHCHQPSASPAPRQSTSRKMKRGG